MMKNVAKACRILSSSFMAISISVSIYMIVRFSYEAFRLHDFLGIDGDVTMLTLLAGPVGMVKMHCMYHLRPWFSWVSIVLGILGVCVSLVLFQINAEASRAHVPAGPFSGLEYVINAMLLIFSAGVSVAAGLAGVLAGIARKLDGSTESME